MSVLSIDELGMYLRNITRTPLLSREAESAIAAKVCRTRRSYLTRLLADDRALRMLLASAQRAVAHRLRIDYVLDVQGISAAARRSAAWTKGYGSCNGSCAGTAAIGTSRPIRSGPPPNGRRPGGRSFVVAARPPEKCSSFAFSRRCSRNPWQA
jgi:hypothetical protein